jgi:FMNH2-dependent dimethyl sulfone monooxygenase
LLAFLHFQEEVEFFGKHVLPLVRQLEAGRNLAVAAE